MSQREDGLGDGLAVCGAGFAQGRVCERAPGLDLHSAFGHKLLAGAAPGGGWVPAGICGVVAWPFFRGEVAHPVAWAALLAGRRGRDTD